MCFYQLRNVFFSWDFEMCLVTLSGGRWWKCANIFPLRGGNFWSQWTLVGVEQIDTELSMATFSRFCKIKFIASTFVLTINSIFCFCLLFPLSLSLPYVSRSCISQHFYLFFVVVVDDRKKGFYKFVCEDMAQAECLKFI